MATRINRERKTHNKDDTQCGPEITIENEMRSNDTVEWENLYKKPNDTVTADSWNNLVSAISGISIVNRGESLTPVRPYKRRKRGSYGTTIR